MSHWRASMGGVGLLSGFLACGPPLAYSAAPSTSGQRAVQTVPSPAPLTRLPLPAETIVVGRWANPQKWLDAVRPWADGLLPLEISLRSRLARASLPVDLSAPIEWLVTLDAAETPPQLSWALSLGLTAPPEVALAAQNIASPAGLACRQVAALGTWRARVVCSHSAEALRRHVPAMTRALPFVAISDANLSMQFSQPVREDDSKPLAEQWLLSWAATTLGVETRNDAINIQLTELASDLDEELRSLLADFDGAIVRISPEGIDRVVASVRLPFRSPASHWLRARVGNAAAGLAPQQFWHFPVDAQEAGFHWSVQWQHLNGQRRKLATLFGRILEFRGLPKRLEIQARQLVETLPFPQAPVAWARGNVGAANASQPWPESLGWNVRTFGGGLSEARYFLRQLIRTFEDPVVGAQLRRLFRAAFGRNKSPQAIRMRSVRGGLPAGSFRLDVKFRLPVAGAEPPPDLSVLFAPSPDDGYAVAWGADAEQLRQLLLPLNKAEWSKTLAGRAGLGELNNLRVLHGGFSSLALLQQEEIFKVLRERFLLPMRPVSEAPHGGVTPILSDWTLIQAPDEEQRTLQLKAVLTATVLRDLMYAIGVD